MAKYTSDTTLSYFFGRIKELFATKSEVQAKQDQLTADQLNAADSGITETKVTKYDAYESTINGKADADDVPTKVSDLSNDSNYQTGTQVTESINNALKDITGIDFKIVETLPETGVKGTIYLLSNGGTGTNIYDEYVYVNSKWEKIGTTDIDLSTYWNQSNLVAITTAEVDELFK